MLRTHLARLLACALLATAPLTLTACKDRADAQNTRGLVALLDQADAAIAADDMETLYRISTPEPMINAILDAQGLSDGAEKDQARAMMETMILGMFQQIDITSHTVDRDAIRYVEAANGATIAYVPMEMEMRAGGQTVTTRGQYIGLQRDGEWFLLTPSDANTIAMMKTAFPELEGQDIAPNTIG